MAASDATPRKGLSLPLQLGLLGAATVMALGVGVLGGGFIRPAAPVAEAEAPARAEAKDAHGESKGGHGEAGAEKPAPVAGHPALVALAPITTNLAAPTDTWLRLELSLEFKDGADAGLAGVLGDDIVSYLRTLKLHQIEGPSGLVHLKEDLNERVRLRSGDKVANVFLTAMVLE